MDNNLFHACYDALFAGKDYAREAATVIDLAKRFGIRAPQRVLEIGCGTGNHTLHLAGNKAHVTAMDTDARMVDLAQKKLGEKVRESVTFFQGPLEELEESCFDLAAALFNVVTYLPDRRALDAFFSGVYRSLVPGGIFVFDCWNGVAVLMDPPSEKRFSVDLENKRIECHVFCRTDFFHQRADLIYRLKVRDATGREIASGEHLIEQFLWTPAEVSFSLQDAGFLVRAVNPAFEPDREARADDWKIMFTCQKKSRNVTGD